MNCKKLIIIVVIILFVYLFIYNKKEHIDNPDLVTFKDIKAPGGIVSSNDQYKLIMQDDGNLVIYKDGVITWSSNRNKSNLVSQDDKAVLNLEVNGTPVIYIDGVAKYIIPKNEYLGG